MKVGIYFKRSASLFFIIQAGGMERKPVQDSRNSFHFSLISLGNIYFEVGNFVLAFERKRFVFQPVSPENFQLNFFSSFFAHFCPHSKRKKRAGQRGVLEKSANLQGHSYLLQVGGNLIFHLLRRRRKLLFSTYFAGKVEEIP